MTTSATVRAGASRPGRWVPYALIALVVLPAIFGTLRLIELTSGPQLMPADPRFTSSPLPLVAHIASAIGYAVLGAFQFSAVLRRRRPGWHRAAGRVLVVLGLAVALSALWMTLFYPRQPGTGELAYLFRLAFGAGTQVFTKGIGPALFGTSELTIDLSLGAGWVVNLTIAEYLIRRTARRRTMMPTSRATAKAGS